MQGGPGFAIEGRVLAGRPRLELPGIRLELAEKLVATARPARCNRAQDLFAHPNRRKPRATRILIKGGCDGLPAAMEKPARSSARILGGSGTMAAAP